MTKDGPSLYLFDHNSTRNISLGVCEFGPQLSLSDFNTQASLTVFFDSPSLHLYDKAGKLRAGLSVYEDGPVLDLFHQKRTPIKGVSHGKAEEGIATAASKEQGTP
jgi:hypothetical protein